MSPETTALPVLRLPPPGADLEPFAASLREALHTDGFAYLIPGEWVPEEVSAAALAASERFFDLPRESKEAMSYVESAAFRGYISQGRENTAGRPDEREQVEIGVEGTADWGPDSPVYERLRGPNQWPAEAPEVRAGLEPFMEAMTAMCGALMEALALSLGLERSAFAASLLPEPNTQMKMARYPPLPAGASAYDADGGVARFGVGAHTDSGYLSLLLQDDVGGLQVQDAATGAWKDAPPLPGAFVLNTGEMLQLATNGFYLATPHRVVNSSTERARVSVPYFFNPSLRAEVAPMALPPALEWRRERPAAVDVTDSHGASGNRLIAQYGLNAFKSLVRSHPAVRERWHSDLELRSDGTVARKGEIAP